MYNEEIEIVKKLYEYLNYKNITHIYIKHNNRIESLMKKYYPHLVFSKYGLKINIKSKERSGIVINYLDNLKKVNAKKVYLIPRTNEDNPLIMFKWNKKYTVNKSKIRKKVQKMPQQQYTVPTVLTVPAVSVMTPTMSEIKKPVKLTQGKLKEFVRTLSRKIDLLNKLIC